MTTKRKKKLKHGGDRPGSGRKPTPTRCQRCNAMCPGARLARAHCSGKSAVISKIAGALDAGAFILPRCAATTERGGPCQRYAVPLSRYCRQHTRAL